MQNTLQFTEERDRDNNCLNREILMHKKYVGLKILACIRLKLYQFVWGLRVRAMRHVTPGRIGVCYHSG